MTRINSAINVKKLTDEHLLSEHREIKRIVQNYLKRKEIGFHNLPKKFTLGTGHVLFFVDKGKFTLDRYLQLHDECKSRNFNVEDYSDNWLVYDEKCFKDYIPTLEEEQLLVDRISERLKNTTKKSWHYYGGQITKEQAIKMLKD